MNPWLAGVLLVMCTMTRDACRADDLPLPVEEHFNCSADGSRWPYLVQVPPQAPVAILVYLHGHYSDQTQGMTVGSYGDCFGRLRRECLRRSWAYVSAWYGGNTWMGPLGQSGLADLIGILRTRWPGQPLYLCGGSMGGTSALVFAVRRPELVDGVIALGAAADVESYHAFCNASADPVLKNIAAAIRIHYRTNGHNLTEELRARSALRNAERLTMPVYLSHGARDGLIPVGPVRTLAARLQGLGRRVQYLELPEGDHDAPVVQVDWSAVLDFISGIAAQ